MTLKSYSDVVMLVLINLIGYLILESICAENCVFPLPPQLNSTHNNFVKKKVKVRFDLQ